METLIINIPDDKVKIVKQILTELGVTMQQKSDSITNYKDKIQNVSVWTEDDLKSFGSLSSSLPDQLI